VAVELFDQRLMSLGITPVNTSSRASFSEGRFTYPGAPAIRRAPLDFSESESATQFAVDNLTFSVVGPEPTVLLLNFGFAGLEAISWRWLQPELRAWLFRRSARAVLVTLLLVPLGAGG